jgi:RimJ/RimL family protein N-acetyltransferase
MPPEPGAAAAALEPFDAFAAALGRRVGRPVDGWAPGDLLVDRLAWDSLRVLEVLGWLRELGVELPEELVGELRTLGDLHHYAVTIGTRAEMTEIPPRRPLIGPRVRLEPLVGQHEAEALALYTSGTHLTRYRLRGATPSPEAFHQTLWDRVLAQFVIVDEQRRVLGLVSAFQPDFRNGHAHIAVIAHPDAPPGAGMEGTGLLIEHLFSEFALRKVYAEVMAPNGEAFASGAGRVFVIEGRLTEHEYLDGAYHDMLVMAITRERWAEHVDGLLGPRAPSGGSAV